MQRGQPGHQGHEAGRGWGRLLLLEHPDDELRVLQPGQQHRQLVAHPVHGPGAEAEAAQHRHLVQHHEAAGGRQLAEVAVQSPHQRGLVPGLGLEQRGQQPQPLVEDDPARLPQLEEVGSGAGGGHAVVVAEGVLEPHDHHTAGVRPGQPAGDQVVQQEPALQHLCCWKHSVNNSAFHDH